MERGEKVRKVADPKMYGQISDIFHTYIVHGQDIENKTPYSVQWMDQTITLEDDNTIRPEGFFEYTLRRGTSFGNNKLLLPFVIFLTFLLVLSPLNTNFLYVLPPYIAIWLGTLFQFKRRYKISASFKK